MADPAAPNSDTLIESSVTINAIHAHYEEEWWQHTRLSDSNIHTNGCDLT